mmetsp:Transcript_21455/g.24304  ORF Transcript_21455/g.24304 Transcript_21455/m.24304 type:complete len:198 (-) Transcript_21455:415-1008(-)
MRALKRLYYTGIRIVAQSIEPLFCDGLTRKPTVPSRGHLPHPNWIKLPSAVPGVKHDFGRRYRSPEFRERDLSFFKKYSLRAIRMPTLYFIQPCDLYNDDQSIFDILEELDAARSLDSIETVVSEDASSETSSINCRPLSGISTVRSFYETGSEVSSHNEAQDEVARAFQQFGHHFPQRAGIGDLLLDDYRSLDPAN